MASANTNAWIETTLYRIEQRTTWAVRVEGVITQAGEVQNDPSGANAFDEASAWMTANGMHPSGWKHWVAGTAD